MSVRMKQHLHYYPACSHYLKAQSPLSLLQSCKYFKVVWLSSTPLLTKYQITTKRGFDEELCHHIKHISVVWWHFYIFTMVQMQWHKQIYVFQHMERNSTTVLHMNQTQEINKSSKEDTRAINQYKNFQGGTEKLHFTLDALKHYQTDLWNYLQSTWIMFSTDTFHSSHEFLHKQ